RMVSLPMSTPPAAVAPPAPPRLTVVVPCYNEAENVPEMVRRVDAALAGRQPERPPMRDAEVPLLDRGVLEELGAGIEPGRLPQLVAVFVEETEERLARLAAARASGDIATLGRLAHALKSAAGTFGAAALARRAGLIEEACRAGDAASADRLVAGLDLLVRRSLAALTEPERVA
ncbi:Hpt domain-containing protein, partial [Elioraea sp. Yellowstone]|uniref:Hpt domain-containing protein n=1 Tax=Elioraea sp. Yellowstone TaxID=2592070 RepID=UPI001F01C5A2